MEVINIVKRKAISLMENSLLKSGLVLAVRHWHPASVVEVDLHLPGVSMYKWTHAQHIKLRVAPLEYRDYTPCGWDADTQTCTLIIDTHHEGVGSQWARSLHEGDMVYYLGIAPTQHQPDENVHLVFLGDESSIAHFFALRQLVKNPLSVKGAIAFKEKEHRALLGAYFAPLKNVQSIGYGGNSEALPDWVAARSFDSRTVFYVVGHSPTVGYVRKLLRAKGFGGAQIRVQGFWK